MNLAQQWIEKTVADAVSNDSNDYRHDLGWSTTAQPMRRMPVSEYLKLANAAMPALREKMIDFCCRHNLTYITIPHADYRTGFEKGQQDFRVWLNEHCQLTGQDPDADIAIVEACVKDEGSSDFKSDMEFPDRIRDYARDMLIVLEGSKGKASARSLDILSEIIDAMDTEKRTASVARKNNFYKPRSNGYSGYKAIWVVEGKSEFYEGFPILAEKKVEHESQQNLHRMTREFMLIERGVTTSTKHFWDRTKDYWTTHFSSLEDPKAKREIKSANSSSFRLDARVKTLKDFSRAAYDAHTYSSGLDRLINPAVAHLHEPVSPSEMVSRMDKAIAAFPGGAVLREIQKSGMPLPKGAMDKYEFARAFVPNYNK